MADAAKGDPLGRCVARPLRWNGSVDFEAKEGGALVAAAVGQVLGTRATTGLGPGEIPWRPEFGSALHLLRHRNIDETMRELARVYVGEAVARWEPRAKVESVDVREGEASAGGKTLEIVIRFRPRARRGASRVEEVRVRLV